MAALYLSFSELSIEGGTAARSRLSSEALTRPRDRIHLSPIFCFASPVQDEE